MKFDALKNRSLQAKAQRWDKKSTGQSSSHVSLRDTGRYGKSAGDSMSDFESEDAPGLRGRS
jgi:hypothetical protein